MTKAFRVLFVGACGIAVSLMPFYSAWAAKALFSPGELQQLDQALDAMEKQNAEKTQTVAPMSIGSLLAEKGLAISKSLLVPKQESFDPGLTTEERTYFERHQQEFRTRILKRELGPVRMDKMRKLFRDRFANKNPFVKREAIWWFLAWIGDADAVTEVEGLLTSQDGDTRFEAANQLTFIGNSSGSKVLEDSLRTKKKQESRNAALALARLSNPKAKDKLVEIIQSTTAYPSDDRSIAVSGLETFRGKDVDDLLMQLLNSREVDVVQSALGVLQGRNIPIPEDAVRRLFEIIEDNHFSVIYRRIAIHVVFEKSAPGLREKALAYRSATDPILKHALLFGLMKKGIKADTRLVVGYLDDLDADTRSQAEYTLRWITGVKLGNPREETLDSVIAKRKAWWEQHKDDPEYK